MTRHERPVNDRRVSHPRLALLAAIVLCYILHGPPRQLWAGLREHADDADRDEHAAVGEHPPEADRVDLGAEHALGVVEVEEVASTSVGAPPPRAGKNKEVGDEHLALSPPTTNVNERLFALAVPTTVGYRTLEFGCGLLRDGPHEQV